MESPGVDQPPDISGDPHGFHFAAFVPDGHVPASLRRRQTLLVVVALLSGFLLVTPTAASSAAGPPYTSWDLRGDDLSYLTGPQHYESGITIGGGQGGLALSVDGWQVGISPAQGDELSPGRTYEVPGLDGDSPKPSFGLGGHGIGCSDLHGSFTVHELVTGSDDKVVSVVFTFAVRCDAQDGTTFGSMAYNASTPAPPLPKTIPLPDAFGMKVSERRVTSGDTVAVKVKLDPSATYRDVSIVARTAGSPDQLIAQQAVGPEGALEVPVRLLETTEFIVSLSLEGRAPDWTTTRTVEVRGKLRSRALRPSRRQGHTAVYKVGRDAIVGTRLSPNHRGDCLYFRAQFRVGRLWGSDATTRCVRLNKHSTAYAGVSGSKALLGISIRVRAEWLGDKRNARARGRWVRLLFVR